MEDVFQCQFKVGDIHCHVRDVHAIGETAFYGTSLKTLTFGGYGSEYYLTLPFIIVANKELEYYCNNVYDGHLRNVGTIGISAFEFTSLQTVTFGG
jgi:hypothetical protein